MKIKDLLIPKVFFHTIVCCSVLGVLAYIHYNKPVLYTFLLADDYWVEYATFVIFMAASMILVLPMIRNSQFRTLGSITLALVCFTIAMEEISWGQRILNIDTPDFMKDLNRQGEINIHNIEGMAQPVILFYWAVAIWAFLFPAISRIRPLETITKSLGIPDVPVHALPYFAIGLIPYLIFSQTSIRIIPLVRITEITELMLSIAFLLVALNINGSFPPQRPSFAYRPVFLFSAILAATALLILPKPNIGSLHWQMQNSAIIDYPHRGMDKQAQELFDHIVNDRSTNPHTLFQFASLLKKHNDQRYIEVLELLLTKRSLLAHEKKDDPKAHRETGIILKALNRDSEALSAFQRSLQSDQERLQAATLDWQIARALISMGETSFEMEDYSAALKHFHDADKHASDWQKDTVTAWITRTQTKTEATLIADN
jgi:hypothetical protein